MTDILSQLEDIQGNIRGIKATWGNMIMTLDNIKSGLKADRQKAIDEAYQQGLNDAWGVAKRIVLTKTDANCPYFTVAELEKIFGCFSSQSVFDTYSASEAIEKVKAYEEHQKVDDEIKVGDEVEAYSGKAIVFCTSINTAGDKVCTYWYPSEYRFDRDRTKNLKKTGRHFPQIAELVKAMKGGAE